MEIVDDVKGWGRFGMGVGVGYVVRMGSGGKWVRGGKLLLI